MRGDVLFYTPQPGNPIDWVIARATAGRFCHCAIEWSSGYVLESTTRGIRLSPSLRQPAARYSPEGDRTAGLTWAGQQVGLDYGWLDIMDQFLRLTLHTTLYVARPRSYDCSDLCTRYLFRVNAAALGSLADAPHLVSPNDLARQLGVQ